VYYGSIVDPTDQSVIDEVLLLYMERPKTYTREDVAEIHCHGGDLVLRRILECTMREGVRLAEPGEFTKRAFLNGRIDLTQAEAVIETIQARTPAGLRIANEQLRGRLSGEILAIRELLLGVLAEIEAQLDFPDEGVTVGECNGIGRGLERSSTWLAGLVSSFENGRLLRDGFVVTIAGRSNAGKSSLLNALLGEERAIVTAVAGTTRDVIEETVSLSGVVLRVVDTAGIRQGRNPVEKEGIRRTKRMIEKSDLVLAVVDRSRCLSAEDEELFSLIESKNSILVLNKIDLSSVVKKDALFKWLPGRPHTEISALTGEGLDRLRELIARTVVTVDRGGPRDRTMVLVARHKRCLEEALEAVQSARKEVAANFSPEIAALEVRSALDRVGEIVGETVAEDVLDRIFSRFCIGK
jgi:tRNA modification GTPase